MRTCISYVSKLAYNHFCACRQALDELSKDENAFKDLKSLMAAMGVDDNETDARPGADQLAKGDKPKKSKKSKTSGEGVGYEMGGKAKGEKELNFDSLGVDMDNMFDSNMGRDDPFHSRCVCMSIA